MLASERSAEHGGLAYIAPDDIDRNPENPRLLLRQGPMDELKKSIYETGILVPLIVYHDRSTGRFILLDGERRWRCAKELNLPRVPANIIAERPLHDGCTVLRPDIKKRLRDLCAEISETSHGLGYKRLATMVVIYTNAPNHTPLVLRGNPSQNKYIGVIPRTTDLPFHQK